MFSNYLTITPQTLHPIPIGYEITEVPTKLKNAHQSYFEHTLDGSNCKDYDLLFFRFPFPLEILSHTSSSTIFFLLYDDCYHLFFLRYDTCGGKNLLFS